MPYLVIIVVVAAAGILRLWLLQRRERGNVETIEGFRSSLDKLSPPTGSGDTPFDNWMNDKEVESVPEGQQQHRRVRSTSRRSQRIAPLDPARRAAAKDRIDARRRAARARAAS